MLKHGKVVEGPHIRMFSLEFLQHLLGDTVHTAYCGNNKQIIADADLAVCPAVALKGQVTGRVSDRMKIGHIFIFLFTRQIRLDVMRVNPFACLNRSNRVADRITIFRNNVIRRKAGQRHFMTLRDVLDCLKSHSFKNKLFSCGNGAQRHSYRIPGIHFH